MIQKRIPTAILSCIAFALLTVSGCKGHDRTTVIQQTDQQNGAALPKAVQNNGNFSYIPLNEDVSAEQHIQDVLSALNDFEKRDPGHRIIAFTPDNHGIWVVSECLCRYASK